MTLNKISESMIEATFTKKVNDNTTQLADTVLLISPVGPILNVANDGTQDISIPLRDYALGKNEIYLYFPPGKYRWDNNIKLVNKKIKLTGSNAIIEHYGSGTNLDIGDVVTHNTEEFLMQGLNFVNKRPKPATGGSGVTGLQISDCVNLTLRDLNMYNAEQYGVNLRRSGGTIKNAVLDNVKVFGVAGTLGTTTSIALETRAASGDGKIENLKMSNCYFEVVDSYINDVGGTTTVMLSNACKLQACDNIEMVNVVFKGGKENGTLTLAHDTRKVKMTNVTMKSDSLISKGITISLAPLLEISAVNCDLGIENFVQSIGINDSLKKAQFSNCRLQKITVVSGIPKNFEFNNCSFLLTATLAIGISDSIFNNCSVDPASTVKNLLVSGNSIKFNNFIGVQVLEVSGSDFEVKDGNCESIRPNGTSARCMVRGLKATSSDRPLRPLSSTTTDWTFEQVVFERTVGGGTGHFVNVQGTRMRLIKCVFRQLDKTAAITYPIYINNATDCEVIEKQQYFDVNKTAAYNIKNETTSTGFKQYEIGDTFLNAGGPQIWNGTSFVNI